MIQLDLFQQRLQILNKEFIWIDKSVEKFVNDCPFIEDMANGVPSAQLSDIIMESYVNLFLSVSELTNIDGLTDLVYYYIYENDFGGIIEYNRKEWNLSDSSQLYDYLLTI